MKKLSIAILLLVTSIASYAQIGYQVSLLNNATGEPRANEKVKVTVKITDHDGGIICEETKNETSNDFGVVSMSVGDSETFSNADWSKLPFFIEASIDGRLIGKSQLLSVPVAEHAKHTGQLSIDLLCSKEWIWRWRNKENENGYFSYKFNNNGTCVYSKGNSMGFFMSYTESFFIDGNDLIIYSSSHDEDDNGGSESSTIYKFNPILNKLFHSSGEVYE